jgi:hypothetical protein
MDKIMVDLYSGLGGASEAFLRSGWDVYRYDNNPAFSTVNSRYYVPRTEYADVDNLMWPFTRKIHFLWASPPCLEFSNAPSAPKSMHKRLKLPGPYEPDTGLLESTIDFINKTKPTYWAIENVLGAGPYFSKVIGKPHRVKVGSALIWGNFPLGYFEDVENNYKKLAGDKYRHSPLRSNYRAKVPLWLSKQMLDSVTSVTLREWV